MKSIEYYFYYGDNVYIITESTPIGFFEKYENIYLKTLSTFEFL